MTGTQRPWWASGESTGSLDDRDPIDAFRAARRSADNGSDRVAAGPGVSEDDVTDDGGTRPPPAAEAHRPELCGICPLCSLARSLEETRPELVEHLTEAARHLAAAARALMEPVDATTGSSAGDRLQRIDLDRTDQDRPIDHHGEAT